MSSNGEDDEIKISVSPVINCKNPCSHELCRGSEGTTITSHSWGRSCKRAWDSSPECNEMHPDLSSLESLFDWTCSVSRVRTDGTDLMDKDVNQGTCPVLKEKGKMPCPLGEVKDQEPCPQSKVIGKGLCSLCKINGEGSCPLGKFKDQGSCPLGKFKDQGSWPLGKVTDEESCPWGKVKDKGSCPLGKFKDQRSCLLDQVKAERSCPLGPSPLRWMWEGFSVERYAPRRRPEATTAGGSKVRPGGLFQIGPHSEREKQRPGTAETPGACRRAPTPQCASVPCDPQAAVGVSTGPGRAAPAARRQVDESRRRARAAVSEAAPPGNGVPVTGATGFERPARARPYNCQQRALDACREFLRQYWEVLDATPCRCAGGRGAGDQRRPLPGQFQSKVTKLVEQRHELIRKNIMERERQELMEQKKLLKERMKRKKIGRLIAARICVCEMDKWRRTQARKRLQCFRKYNREQAARYQAELREMKERVAQAPFLFEQVIQNNVRGTINRLFSKVLQKVCLDEELVCKLGTADCESETQLIELEAKTGDWEGVCAVSHGEQQCHTAREEPLCDHDGDSTNGPRTDPAIDC
ncbi:uncharacterized protein LOC121272955 [Carcharodon carcharias]|uniref:uncharacterized protein LOC121272955 n=1 Tax=Carcharodon carcharias TaxID=13397 RepID=UPI001B7E2A4C|nr:uncharacterized protein LOC121272955 [Carcharodon carcharias]